MHADIFSKSLLGSFWAFAIALQACAVAQDSVPASSDAGDGTLSAGGLIDAGSAGSDLGASGTGTSGSTSVVGVAGGESGGFGGMLGLAGAGGGSSLAGASAAGSGSSGASAAGSGGAGAGGHGGAAGAGTAGSSAAGSSSSAGSGATSCSVASWSATMVYQMGDKASKGGMVYTAAYYTQNNDPTDPNQCCGDGKPWASSAPCN